MPEEGTSTRLREEWVFDRRTALAWLIIAVFVARGAWNLAGSDPFPWAHLIGTAFGAFVIGGPFAWLARGLLAASTRATLVLVGVGLAILALPFGVTALLLLELPLFAAIDAFLVGLILGFVAVVVVERTTLPETVVEVVDGALEAAAPEPDDE